jgi:Holliday junction resolvasome RuvABC ATP-dependent DNA helicase subunit
MLSPGGPILAPSLTDGWSCVETAEPCVHAAARRSAASRQVVYEEDHRVILGPRQCGKTTLARAFKADRSFDLENPRDLARLEQPQLALENLKGLIVIDEIQRLLAICVYMPALPL